MKENLNAIAADLRRAFIDRPVPEGIPREDVFDTTRHFLDLLCDRLRSMVDVSNDLFDRLLPQGAAEPAMNASFTALRAAVAELIDSYHTLWRRPFPSGLEMGQILLSAAFEKPMRDYLTALENVLNATSKAEAGRAEQPVLSLELQIDEELARLQTWLEQTALAQRREMVRSRGFGLGALAVSFGLGWLLGDCD